MNYGFIRMSYARFGVLKYFGVSLDFCVSYSAAATVERRHPSKGADGSNRHRSEASACLEAQLHC